MAFALVNGQWTGTTLDVDAVLQHYNQQDMDANGNGLEGPHAPELGLLTQTTLQSPLVHWILPVRLRDRHSNDVAFIGDNFVQIKELRQDGLLWDVVQKNNFGARIRSACVVGPTRAKARDDDGDILSATVKEEFDMKLHPGQTPSDNSDALPPQALLLQLDTGDSLFLRLRRDGTSGWDFVSSRQRLSKPMLAVQPGMHLAVDPSSRYVAVGCSEGIFAIYALNSREKLEQQHARGEPIKYIRSERYIYIRGALYKMHFLYPSPDDPKHVILLLLVTFKGRMRMQLYEWEAGYDLRFIRPHSERGHLLEPCRQMPLLVIPLTIKSRFLLVSEDSVSLCKDILHGSPVFSDSAVLDTPTDVHQGGKAPLWTAWARPPRLPYHTVKQDDVYLVREDGLVKYLEMTTQDDDLVEVGVGALEFNCGKAFTCLDYNHLDGNTGDLLITGGDSCPGATYAVLARKTPTLREILPNWSPALDIVTTSKFQDQDGDDPRRQSRYREHLPRPDRIFACIGKGSHGAITEFRYGLEARLGLETEFSIPVLDAWVSPSSLCTGQEDGGSLFLLSLADRSTLLYLSADGSGIAELEQSATSLDLRYRTLITDLYGDCAVQVTERSVSVTNGNESHIFEADKLLEIKDGDEPTNRGSIIDDAATRNSIVVFTTHFEHNTYVHLLDLRPRDDAHGREFNLKQADRNIKTLRHTSSSVTSLAICTIEETLYAVVAELDGKAIDITFYPVNGGEEKTVDIPEVYLTYGAPVEGLISMCVCDGLPGSVILICGTRNGLVVCMHLDEEDLMVTSFWSACLGATSVKVKADDSLDYKKQVFMTCDSKLYSLNVPAARETWPTADETTDRRAINHVWLTDATNPCLQQPKITSVATSLPALHDDNGADLLIVSGSRLLLTSLNTKSKPVPRTISIGGTPTRLLYSQSLQVLIVAAVIDGRSALLFIDPDTGEDLSRAADKRGNRVEHVAGLGEKSGRIYRLLEWSFKKDGKTWSFIVSCTNTGRLLIMSVEREKPGDTSMLPDDPPTPGIRYFTRYKFRCPRPVYSVTAFADGLIYCAGTTLFCDRLNLTDKRFETVARYELPSSAVDLSFDQGKIYATTIAHSLEVLRLVSDANGTVRIVHTHGDQVTRNSLHHRIMGKSSASRLSLVSDKSCTVVGLWSTNNAKADSLDLVFEAHLSHSILRFRGGSYRPIWDPSWEETRGVVSRLNPPPHTSVYSDVLGLSIDGSLHQFTVIDMLCWRLLKFLQNLAMESPRICEFTYTTITGLELSDLAPQPDPRTAMHIDGDILRRIGPGDLEVLLRVGDDSAEAADIRDCFCSLARELHPVNFFNHDEIDLYIRQVYRDLHFFLRPVI